MKTSKTHNERNAGRKPKLKSGESKRYNLVVPSNRIEEVRAFIDKIIEEENNKSTEIN